MSRLIDYMLDYRTSYKKQFGVFPTKIVIYHDFTYKMSMEDLGEFYEVVMYGSDRSMKVFGMELIIE